MYFICVRLDLSTNYDLKQIFSIKRSDTKKYKYKYKLTKIRTKLT